MCPFYMAELKPATLEVLYSVEYGGKGQQLPNRFAYMYEEIITRRRFHARYRVRARAAVLYCIAV